MTRQEIDQVVTQAAHHYGKRHQCLKTIEECGELIQALSKFLNSDATPEIIDNLFYEMADVLIMLHQLAILMGPGCVDYAVIKKAQRLKEMLEKC